MSLNCNSHSILMFQSIARRLFRLDNAGVPRHDDMLASISHTQGCTELRSLCYTPSLFVISYTDDTFISSYRPLLDTFTRQSVQAMYMRTSTDRRSTKTIQVNASKLLKKGCKDRMSSALQCRTEELRTEVKQTLRIPSIPSIVKIPRSPQNRKKGKNLVQ